MPFFWFIDIINKYISLNNKPSLRERQPEFFMFKKHVNFYTYLKKRVSSFISVRFFKAGMTVELSLILPFFLFAMFSLISIMDVMKIKGCVDMAVAEIGNEISIKSYSGNQSDMLTTLYIKKQVINFLKKNLSDEEFRKISKSLKIKEVSISDENNIFSFVADYKIEPEFALMGFEKIKWSTEYYGHIWIGYKRQKEAKEMVFLSKKASVYHLDKNCKYLNVTIMEILSSNLENYRNSSGEKYRDCNFCNDLNRGIVVYITPEGNNYHTIRNCIGLTRSVYTIPKDAVKGKRVCTGCGK